MSRSSRTFTVNTGLGDFSSDDDESGEESDSPFTKCADCGKIYVAGSGHVCEAKGEGEDRPNADTREGRELLIDLDHRDRDEDVLFLRGRSDSSYHRYRLVYDLDAMETFYATPESCPAEPRMRNFQARKRGYCQDTGRPPCLYCHREVKRRRDEGENPVGK